MSTVLPLFFSHHDRQNTKKFKNSKVCTTPVIFVFLEQDVR
ncbi:MAG: hypothetical protein OJF59_000522 [Cytophagales bacterium]|nr:MAG: hypothetical protein OJF59_000522 [Cytophagales bacterium]